MRFCSLTMLIVTGALASADHPCGKDIETPPTFTTTLVSQDPNDREFNALLWRYEQLGRQLAPAAAIGFHGFTNADFDRQDVLNNELNAIGAAIRGWLTVHGRGPRFQIMRLKAEIALESYAYLETRRLMAPPFARP